jgi:CDP-4-dehydro-6-deoxyglucose reductase
MHSVTVRPSGRVFSVEADETVLAAALRAGVNLPYGCRSGACGTCKGRLVEGRVSHSAHSRSALTPDEELKGSALFCSAFAHSDLVIEQRELSGFGDIPIRKMPCRIANIRRASDDVAIVSLQLPAAERLQYRAGQYIEFLLKDASRRSYSIATPPHADDLIELHIRHMPGGAFTDALFGVGGASGQPPTIKERDILRCEAPLGTFFLREDTPRPIVLLASGTGFAPIKAIAEHIFHKRINRAEGDRPARRVVLYWGARRRADLYLNEMAERWAREQPDFSYVPVLSDATPEDAWAGRTGFVHRAVMEDLPDLSGWQVYACGAPVMVNAARKDFTERCGLPAEHFLADSFTSQADLAK